MKTNQKKSPPKLFTFGLLPLAFFGAAACSKPNALQSRLDSESLLNAAARGKAASTGASSSETTSVTPVPAPVPSFDAAKNEVHFEAVDANGAFTQHQVLLDPLRGQYQRGAWTASHESRALRINSMTGSTEKDLTIANRVNIAFVGDGYTTAELPAYGTDVTNVIQQLKTQEPFSTYSSYFNFHRIDVVSAESGVSQDPKGQTRNTTLGMSFYCGGIDRLLCGNLDKIMREAQNSGPVDAVFAMANSASYGGAGYMTPPVATFGARNPGSLELALHEFGHSFGLLADEYDTAGTTAPCSTFANIATNSVAQMKSRQEKWFRWLGVNGIGAFEGACYHTRGLFRPTENSKMRTLNEPFGDVNIEHFILQLYNKVHPIEAATPPGTYTKDLIFHVAPMHPAGHNLTVTWTLDGVHVASLDGAVDVNSAQLNLKSGSHNLSVRVTDPTKKVRDEEARSKYLTQNLSWTLKLAR